MSAPTSGRKAQRKAVREKGAALHEEKLWTHLQSASWLILGVTVATFFLHHFGWLNPFETTSLDFLLRLREPVKPKYVWLVAITDKDYADPKLFKKTSPLDPEQLGKVIAAVASLQPRVIGVDVDTSDSQGVRPETKVPIIWGQRMTSAEDANERHTLPVLGNEQPQPAANELGISAMPADADGAVRRYQRKIPVADGEVDSLPWAVVKAFCRSIVADATATSDLKSRCQRLLDSESRKKYQRPLLLTFSKPPHSAMRIISASDVLHIAANDGWKNNPTFRDGIVMLGGTFALSGDVSYKTPLGTRAGVQLFSDAIETELQGRPITPLNEVLMVIFEITGGYLLAAWHFFSKGWSGVTLRVMAVPVLAMASSFFAFSSLAYWANFVPVLAGVLIHELYEHFKHHRDLIREVRELKDNRRRPRKGRG
jgi:CHASE2 domain-containing sensor protein